MRYYFIYYLVEEKTTIRHLTQLIDIHPFQWQREQQEQERNDNVMLVNYKEITQEEYAQYNEVFEETNIGQRNDR
jgi:hypothetical protein